MDRNEVMRLAREAGGLANVAFHNNQDGDSVVFSPRAIYRFAALVAAAEREECAKVCEERDMHDMSEESIEAQDCAKAIRARGKQEKV